MNFQVNSSGQSIKSKPYGCAQVRFRSGQKIGLLMQDPHQTPQNAQKTPQKPRNAPKTLVLGVFWACLGVRFIINTVKLFSGQVRSDGDLKMSPVSQVRFRSCQVPDLISLSGQSGQVNLTCRMRRRNQSSPLAQCGRCVDTTEHGEESRLRFITTVNSLYHVSFYVSARV